MTCIPHTIPPSVPVPHEVRPPATARGTYHAVLHSVQRRYVIYLRVYRAALYAGLDPLFLARGSRQSVAALRLEARVLRNQTAVLRRELAGQSPEGLPYA